MELTDTQMPLSAFPEQPVYNIKAVSKRTGIGSATLRAWERRHGLPSPNRTRQGYRLYSERDVATLFWLTQQLNAGVSIGQAARKLHHLVTSGQDPEVHIPPPGMMPGSSEASRPRSPEALRTELVDALMELDERTADELLTEAAALYTPETTLIEIFQAAFHAIRVQADRAVLVERFALNYAKQRLVNMLQAAPAPQFKQSVVTIGFAEEQNEIDLLILGFLLRRQGWPVAYLGSDLDPNLLVSSLSNLDAGLVLLYVDDPANAARLTSLATLHGATGKHIALIICGNALDRMPELRGQIAADYLGADIRSILREIPRRLANGEDSILHTI